MPNGRPYESPLNRLADALPNFILQMQDMKMRQEAQEAMNSYRTMMLNERISAREAQEEATIAMEQMGRMTGRYDPPEVDVLSKRIEKDLDILRDPDLELKGYEAGEIDVIKSRVKSNLTERRRLSGREYYVDPSLIRLAPKKPTVIEPPPGTIQPPAKTESEIELEKLTASKRTDPAWLARIARAEAKAASEKAPPPAPEVAPAVEGIPPGFPDPSGFPEGQTATFNGEPWIIRNGQWGKVK